MIGRALNHYKITSQLGKGGMGEVYLAEDTKLHREVALKVLPDELAGDADRRARFEREARAVAALNHPNIVTIHSVEESGEHHFITMELVRERASPRQFRRRAFPWRGSSTLRSRWPTRSAPPTRRASRTATSNRTT